MKIKALTLFTHQLKKQKDFFISRMGFTLLKETSTSFSFQVGYSELTFEASENIHQYHYCFLIPCNQLDASMHWLEEQGIKVIEDEDGRRKQHFESWNADAIYFYDADGSVAEFISRHDLENESEEPFNLNQILCINEIGMPSTNVKNIYDKLSEKIKPMFWKGDLERFGTFGSQNGLFLLINYHKKRTWFPTTLRTAPLPCQVRIEVDSKRYDITFENGSVLCKDLSTI